jgi:hypothetical protein
MCSDSKTTHRLIYGISSGDEKKDYKIENKKRFDLIGVYLRHVSIPIYLSICKKQKQMSKDPDKLVIERLKFCTSSSELGKVKGRTEIASRNRRRKANLVFRVI